MTSNNMPSRDTLYEMRKTITKRNESMPQGRPWRIMDFVIYIMAMLVFALAIRAVIVEPIRVKGTSMLDGLHEGDYMVVEKLSYVFDEPKLGDIVIIWYPNRQDHSCVKRIIGVEGDKIVIKDGYVTVNGIALDEPYVYSRGSNHDCNVVVPENCVFVLGDNRTVSSDSASIGSIPKNNVVGRVRCVLWPLNRIKTVR